MSRNKIRRIFNAFLETYHSRYKQKTMKKVDWMLKAFLG